MFRMRHLTFGTPHGAAFIECRSFRYQKTRNMLDVEAVLAFVSLEDCAIHVGDASFVERRKCTIVDRFTAPGAARPEILRHYIVPVALIMRPGSDWADFKQMFENSLTDQHTGVFQTTALMWCAWPEHDVKHFPEGLGMKEEDGEPPVSPPRIIKGLMEAFHQAKKRVAGGPSGSGLPSGHASGGLADSETAPKKSKIDLTEDEEEQPPVATKVLVLNASQKDLEVKGAGIDDVEMYDLKQEYIVIKQCDKADAAIDWHGPKRQGLIDERQPWADHCDVVLMQDLMSRMKRTCTDWVEQLEELPTHKQGMIESLAAHHKVVYVVDKRPLEGLMLATKKMWKKLEKSLEEDTVDDATLYLKFAWDMRTSLLQYMKTLREGTGVPSEVLVEWLKDTKKYRVYGNYVRARKVTLGASADPWKDLAAEMVEQIQLADAVFTEVLEGLPVAEQARLATRAGSDLTRVVTMLVESTGGNQQAGRGYIAPVQPTYQPYGGGGRGVVVPGRGRGRGAPAPIPPELYLPPGFVNTHINGPRGTPDRRCMTHMRHLLKGTPACRWANNCRNGSHDPATPEGAQALMTAWEAAGRPDRVQQGAT